MKKPTGIPKMIDITTQTMIAHAITLMWPSEIHEFAEPEGPTNSNSCFLVVSPRNKCEAR
jgi:hypothetical protein